MMQISVSPTFEWLTNWRTDKEFGWLCTIRYQLCYDLTCSYQIYETPSPQTDWLTDWLTVHFWYPAPSEASCTHGTSVKCCIAVYHSLPTGACMALSCIWPDYRSQCTVRTELITDWSQCCPLTQNHKQIEKKKIKKKWKRNQIILHCNYCFC